MTEDCKELDVRETLALGQELRQSRFGASSRSHSAAEFRSGGTDVKRCGSNSNFIWLSASYSVWLRCLFIDLSACGACQST